MPEPDLLQRARGLLQRGDMAGAITDLRGHLQKEPDDDEAWLTLGTAYAAIGHVADALPALARAVELDGGVVEARLAYARMLVRATKLDDAAFQLIQASRLAPADARILRELGVVMYDLGRWDKAVRWLEQAAAADPADARASYALGLAHEGRRDPGAAMAAYREAIRRDPGFADARRTLADLYASMGEHEQAIGELEAVLAIDRTDEKAAHNRDVLARALAEMRNTRLLAKGVREIEASALVQQGQLRHKETEPTGETAVEISRWTAPMIELRARLEGGVARELVLVLTDPDRAARTEDDAFKVTVVASDGRLESQSFATAATLTFLREALGCPMTAASALYARLLSGEPSIEWGGTRLAFVSFEDPSRGRLRTPRGDNPRHGISARLEAR